MVTTAQIPDAASTRTRVATMSARPEMSTPKPFVATAPVAALAVLSDHDLRVPVLGGATVRHVNLDVAASAPPLAVVADRVAELAPWYSSVHRGTGYPSEIATELVDDARLVIAQHVGARADDVVVFTRNTTDSLNLLASAVPGDVVVLDIEHHANLLPWRSRRVIVAPDTIAETLVAVERELARRPAALLSVTGASNITGEVLPIERLAAIAHRHGARIAVDGAQLVPHRRVDLAASGIDYVSFSAHKAYAPYGVGALVGRADWLDIAPPHLAGGGAVERVSLEAVTWESAPERHEAGTPNVLGVAAFATALLELERLGDDARCAHESTLTNELTSGLESIDGVRLVRGFGDATQFVGIATLELEHGSIGRVAAALAAEHGISVRAGRFCAHPYFDRIARRSNGLRASLGLGSSSADVERFVDALARIVHDGPRAEYVKRSTGWHPAADDRPRPRLFGAALAR